MLGSLAFDNFFKCPTSSRCYKEEQKLPLLILLQSSRFNDLLAEREGLNTEGRSPTPEAEATNKKLPSSHSLPISFNLIVFAMVCNSYYYFYMLRMYIQVDGMEQRFKIRCLSRKHVVTLEEWEDEMRDCGIENMSSLRLWYDCLSMPNPKWTKPCEVTMTMCFPVYKNEEIYVCIN